MDVKVRLFALAKQKAGRSELALKLPEVATVADLRREIAHAFPELAPWVPNMMIAVDAEYADDAHAITAGCEIALIPPVSGGAPLASIVVSRTPRLHR